MVQKVRHYHNRSPVILGLPCVMVGLGDMAFGFSYFFLRVWLLRIEKHISSKIQQVVKFVAIQD